MVFSYRDRVLTMPDWMYYPVALMGYIVMGVVAIPVVMGLILMDWLLPR